MKFKELATVIKEYEDFDIYVVHPINMVQVIKSEVGNNESVEKYGNYEINRIEPDYDEYYDKKVINIYLFDNEIFDIKE